MRNQALPFSLYLKNPSDASLIGCWNKVEGSRECAKGKDKDKGCSSSQHAECLDKICSENFFPDIDKKRSAFN
jgi:hypothetical protein